MSEDTALNVDLTLSLGYKHGFGAMSPFMRALTEGRALASRCPKCGDVRFPPRRICLNDGTQTHEHLLDGTGTVVRLTIGSVPIPLSAPAQEQIFAEVAMDGTDNRVLARLTGDPARLLAGAKVRLTPPPHTVPHPIQALVFEPY
ncbi:zinc ribbon domain-containing protein [Roseovarius aestuarii]|nr:zinc ribbon domain-containing protein [Roseovarius aestuarii]